MDTVDVPLDQKAIGAALGSKDLEELLNIIDELRAQGISRYIDLPQLIVCGDQSSGKSSVLEAVSSVRFPTKDNLCTRFPTELVLRRGQHETSTVTIVPDASRSEDEKKSLQAFRVETEVSKDFGSIMDAAGEAMGLGTGSKVFSYDVLRVELVGPKLPHLTLVDLPGLFHAGNSNQSVLDAEAVKNLVTGYMKKRRSIILAVISAKNDYANQIVTTFAQEVDPLGERTLGIVTKPDTLDEGSESEIQYANLARNQDVKLRLGWHVLKNRDFKTKEYSAAMRDEAEDAFLSQGIWASLPPTQLGINTLRPRLARVLRDQILTELPSLTTEVNAGIRECKKRLEKLGGPRVSQMQQKVYLHNVSQEFCQLVQAANKGHYHNRFFNSGDEILRPQKRLRAVVFNLLHEFAEKMRVKGHQYKTCEVEQSIFSRFADDSATPVSLTRQARLKGIASLIKANRGLELPGFQKYDNITILFHEQCAPWKMIVEEFADRIFSCVRATLHLVLEETADEETKGEILRYIINPALEDLRQELDNRVSMNLEHHINGDPITFNHYFTENLQKLRSEHETELLKVRLAEHFSCQVEDTSKMVERKFSIDRLVRALTQKSEADMVQFTASEALHFMEAYYKVALKFFVDDFSIHTIEQGLMRKLGDIFSPTKTLQFDDDMIARIAGETEESKTERVSATAKLDILEKALKALHRLDRGQTAKVKVEQTE